MNTEERISFLRKELEGYNHSYYVLDTPVISDFEFDKLMSELIGLEEENPEYQDDLSPTKRVGGMVIDSFNTINDIVERRKENSSGWNYIKSTYNFENNLYEEDWLCPMKYDGSPGDHNPYENPHDWIKPFLKTP